MLILDNFALFFNLIFVLVAVITVLISFTYMEREDLENGEYYVLLLFSVAGLMLMASAGDLIIVFLGLELLSLPLYMLAGFSRLRLQSDESAVKYVLLGAFASGFLLYGIALMYGATETTNLAGIATAVAQDGFSTLLLIGMGLLIVGLGFKAALVPFHMWTPDVYEGAPTPVTAYMSVAAKTATFAALARVFVGAVPEAPVETVWVLGGVAAATMIVGNVAALVQEQHQASARVLLHRPRRLPARGPGGRQRRYRGDARPRYPEPPVLFRRVFLHEPRSLRRRHLLGAAR